MAYSPIGGSTNSSIGKLLQIVFSEGVRSQISADYKDWEQIQMVREGDPMGRQIQFMFQKSYGPAAVQYRNPSNSSAFPSAQAISTSEHTATYKELDATIEVDYNLWFQLQKSPSNRYADQLALEIQSKTVAIKRRMAADLYGDGTGVVCQLSAAGNDAAIASGEVTITVSDADASWGHFGYLEYGDLLLAKALAGTAVSPSGGSSFYAYRVKSKNRRAGTAVLELVSSSGTVLTSYTASNLASTNVFYRIGQETIPDLTSLTNYSDATEVWAGLESLAANDGRSVHGITMSGMNAGTRVDNGGNAIDVSALQSLMDDVKINVGEGVYSWKKMCMAPETHAAFVESRETDRRFIHINDTARGIKKFGFQHGNDFLESYTSEFIKKKRLWVLPEAKAGNKVLEWHGTDFEPVRVRGSDEFMMKPSSSGGHERRVVSYLHSSGVMIAKHPASIACLTNFTA